MIRGWFPRRFGNAVVAGTENRLTLVQTDEAFDLIVKALRREGVIDNYVFVKVEVITPGIEEEQQDDETC